MNDIKGDVLFKKVAFAADHGGVDLKNQLVDFLESFDVEVVDLGTNGADSVDYPDYAELLAKALEAGEADSGILVCGTGIGISIAANRYRHIRAAMVYDGLTASLCREHNDANVLALGGRTTGIETAKDCVRIFLTTPFAGGRHKRRVDKMS